MPLLGFSTEEALPSITTERSTVGNHASKWLIRALECARCCNADTLECTEVNRLEDAIAWRDVSRHNAVARVLASYAHICTAQVRTP
jgi:hypothetical protein